eukprot:CAMPEP_0204643422 /NCGR_PEP_ID=MMETSP0718-20130828/693_1 /ASSEMBLY_ACC=CAM_ASM_000674 /TAXON_ID=230516 /ORGANISM="Chaetoceros curvisetus" /LENGTH=177 /DNA_ID=CAMNT_0051664621 /DNA_START=149 /DNA_END=682 /DNA_ORIENTATION=-
MNTETDESDEFFGDQSSCDEYENGSRYEYAYEDASKEHHDGHGYGSLSKHDHMAQHEQYKNIGYHESFDQFKEVKLQEGFEAGYTQHINDAHKIGMLLGRSILRDVKLGTTRTQAEFKSQTRDQSEGIDQPHSSSAVTYVKKFLEKAQNEDGKIVKEGGDDIREVVSHLEQKLGEKA